MITSRRVKEYPVARLTQLEWNRLPEYSIVLPKEPIGDIKARVSGVWLYGKMERYSENGAESIVWKWHEVILVDENMEDIGVPE